MSVEMETIHKRLSRSVEDVHTSTALIEHGLNEVLALVGKIVEGNQDLEDKEAAQNAAPRRMGEYNKIKEVVDIIRKSVSGFAEMNHQFEEKLNKSTSKIRQLNERLESFKKEALVDPLTGVANRRKFEQVLLEHFKLIDDYAGELAILLADIDHFKEINDQHGHPIGDSVLRLVSRTFSNNLKGSDTVARWGGDEFAVALPATSLENAVRVAEHIRQALSAQGFVNKDSGARVGKVTLSIGATAWQEGDDDETILARADKALYEAKKGGRNKVCKA